jgi:exodeoxyribonuclease VII small subunit
MTEETLTYEEALTQLEEIVTRLEDGNLPLQETLDLYAAGQELLTLCSDLLDNAELRLQELQVNDDGELFTSQGK